MHSKYVSDVGYDEPIMQGDILKIKIGDSLYEYGVIITADCDIANSKHRGEITYLRILSFDSYIKECWLVDDVFYKPDKSEIKKYKKQISNFRSAAGIDGISEEAFTRMMEFDVSRFSESISSKVSVVSEFVSIQNKNKAFERYNISRDILELAAALKNKSPLDVLVEGRRQIADSSPLDAFFIGDYIFGEYGLVALRQVRIMDYDKVLISLNEFQQKSAGYALRIRRMKDVYKYAVTQMFGNLFSRIGLPEHHVDDKKAAAGLSGVMV